MAKELIFIADDLGMNSEINDAILHAHNTGHLNGAALMMAQPGTEGAIALARANPGLQIGWHLHLNDSVPATVDRWPWGESPARAGVSIGLSAQARGLMRREVARQWELFQATGLECGFITPHHPLHAPPFVYRALLEVVGPQFQGWIRLGRPCAFNSTRFSLLWSVLDWMYLNQRRSLSVWRSTDTLWGVRPHLTSDEVHAIIPTLPDGFHEFLFHPRSRSCPDTLCLLQLRSLLAHC